MLRNALVSWGGRGLDRFASAQGLAVERRHAGLPEVAAVHALAALAAGKASVGAVSGTRGDRRFAAFTIVCAAGAIEFDWRAVELSGLAGRAAFVAVAVERAAGASRDAAPLRSRLRGWHVAVARGSAMAWRDGTGSASELEAALVALAAEPRTAA